MSTFMAPVRRIIWMIAGFSVFLNMLVLATPLYMLQIYDRVLVSRSFDTLVMISIVAFLAVLVFGLLEGVRGIMANRAAAQFELGISRPVFERILQNERSGMNGTEPLRDISLLKGFISNRVALSLLDLPFAPLFVVLVFFIHPTLGYITLVGALLLMGLAAANDRATFAVQQQAGVDTQTSMGVAQSIIRNSETVRAMGMFDAGMTKWAKSNNKSLLGQDRVGIRNSTFFGLTRFFRLLLQIALLGVGGYLVLINEMTAGMIFASSIISSRALGPIEQAVGAWRSLSQARLAHRRLTNLFDKSASVGERTSLPRPTGRIDVETLVYAAPGTAEQDPVLKGLNFKVEAGGVLVILGASGAGKSTLARLLVGAASPSRGCVRLDGADIMNWPDAARFAHVGYLPQSIELMPGTIAENISRLDPNRVDSAVVEAAGRAGVHELIMQLPEGYETLVGPGGRGLSGGQTQRVALARAFYGSPAFIVLDEPNAHLDIDGERQLSETISAAKAAGTTVVIITQRTGVMQVADKVMILSQGEIEAWGPRDEMMARLIPGSGARAARNSGGHPSSATGSATGRLTSITRISNDPK
ncbi:type I secretion system permease/ATPase [Hoeflea sp. IMCC20628]|uniref:type I secretion system permease/ATPase n=1 Tax=Hoeflea sp. IMCC20628 TaxID=1620421 RepID=UPI0018CDF706|nr:type I secretion system permease/ATPase [Hoeflea sp. IMCC20628]